MTPQMMIRILPAGHVLGQSVNMVDNLTNQLELDDDNYYNIKNHENIPIQRKRKRLTHLSQDQRLLRRFVCSV